jgi:hypothetical protein
MEAQSQIFKMHGATCVKMNAKGQLKIVFLIMKAKEAIVQIKKLLSTQLVL